MQTLSRQLAELKDSLQFSNKSCEQLEGRGEELEKANTSLRKLCEGQQAQLENKTTAVQDLEEKLDSVQREYQRVKERCDSLELSQLQAVGKSCMTAKLVRKKSTSFSGELVEDSSEWPTGAQRERELLKTMDEVTEKLRTATYQKQKYEKGLREVLAENQSLSRSLERAEADASELQARLRAYEEAMEKQSLERSYGSPMPYPAATLLTSSTPTGGSVFQYGSLTSPAEDSSQLSHKSSRTTESVLGTSLFSELDSHYSNLQERYDQLLQQCTCSAGLAHRNQLKNMAAGDGGTGVLSSLATQPQASSSVAGAPFKDLFEEVFATLKQTAAVADRLIERKKNGIV